MRANWRIGSFLGIPFYVDSSWLLILAFVTLINVREIDANGLSGNTPWLSWITGFIMALLLFSSVLLHELGHSLVARSQGISVNSITLFLFGGIASIDRESETPKDAFFVAIAGPLVSFSLFGIFFSIDNFFQLPSLLQYLAKDLRDINLVLALFNLIPGLPLDGGQVLKALVWQLTGNRFQGVHWAANTGKILGWFGIALGIFFLLLTGEFSSAWIALIGWFVLRNADAYDKMTSLQESLLKIVASEAMTNEFRVVNANLTLLEFTQTYLLTDLNSLTTYYAASDGRYRGLIKVQDLQSIERSQWETKTLTDIAHPLTEIISVEEKTPLVAVIQKLEEIKEKKLTVLSPAGAVSGIIDRGDIVKIIATKNNLSIPEAEIKRIKVEGTYPPYLQLSTIVKTLEITSQ